MIKKLQRKFIMISMVSIILVTLGIFGVILIEDYSRINREIDGLLNLISENNGQIPEYKPRNDELANVITEETQFSTRYFFIKLDNSGEIAETNMQYIASVEEDDAENILQYVIEQNQMTNYYENYKYKVTPQSDGYLIVFLDCTTQLNNLKSMIEHSMWIIIIGLIIVFIVVSVLSKKVLTPIIESIEKQKQFITNAGHELKTPVAVILANVDVMEMTSKENTEWLKSIRNQANRLDILIKSLLNLAKVEEKDVKVNYTDFSLTKMIKEEIDEFKAISKDKQIDYDDSKDIQLYADSNSIKQLITILLDNALKYTPENGIIKIRTEKQGKKTKMTFTNTCENINSINTKKLFDRFYREDKSRSKTKDGYGIGLSIAKSIVESHKGKIFADINKESMICFTIII